MFMSYILLVEDNDDHARLVQRTLAAAGFAVRHVTLGREAVAIVQRSYPDLILLDLDLPDMDGVEVLSVLSPILVNADTAPVIAVTGRAPQEIAGCAGWLQKPFTAAMLLRVVEECWQVQRRA
jgi:CheY-like chemotaxis protein